LKTISDATNIDIEKLFLCVRHVEGKFCATFFSLSSHIFDLLCILCCTFIIVFHMILCSSEVREVKKFLTLQCEKWEKMRKLELFGCLKFMSCCMIFIAAKTSWLFRRNLLELLFFESIWCIFIDLLDFDYFQLQIYKLKSFDLVSLYTL
jgi:hypothetical protein